MVMIVIGLNVVTDAIVIGIVTAAGTAREIGNVESAAEIGFEATEISMGTKE
jgi:hypothetical protein